MNRNQLLLISIVSASLLAITASQMVWSKAHVPIFKVQVCHIPNQKVIAVGSSALFGHLRHGDFQVPACSTTIVRMTGSDCSDLMDGDGDGKADGADPIIEGSPGCPVGAGLF